MAEDTLAADTVIADVVRTLKNPEDYVCRVLIRMKQCENAHGASLVRIGVTGRGVTPNFAVEYPNDMGGAEVFEAYYGVNGDPMEDLGTLLDELMGKAAPDHVMVFRNWSTRTMTYGQVQAVLGEIRKRIR